MPFEGFENGKNIQATDSLALVLLTVNGTAQKVLQSLEKNTQIRSASIVPGEYDILTTVYGKNLTEVLSSISKIAQMQGVESTETLLAYKPIWA